MSIDETGPIAVLASGGIDSAVLTSELCREREAVFPIWVRCGLRWDAEELDALRRFLNAIEQPALRPLVTLDQPVRDVYGSHWSVTGENVPDTSSPDEAVYLPGRNLILITKAAVWCVMNRVAVIALAPLAANPFPDSTPEFYAELQRLVARALGWPIRILRPFAHLSKADVLRRGATLPLELTFSCINPVRGGHCGACNKCEERRLGFDRAGLPDRTDYAATAPSRGV